MANDNIHILLVCPGPVESDIASHTIRNPENPVVPEGAKMPTERCTSLIAKGMFYKLPEIWIIEQPLLSFAYIARYAPGVMRKVIMT